MIHKIGAAIVHNDQLLVVSKKGKKGFYMLPGGKVEKGESEKATLARELEEEINVQVKESSLLGHFETKSMFDSAEVMQISVYEVTIIGTPTPNNEISEIKWIPLSTGEANQYGSGITKYTLPALREKYYG